MFMKKLQYLAALAATVLVACGDSNSGSSLDFETITVERSVSITQEAGAPQCSVNLQLVMAKGGAAERGKAVNETIVRELLDMEGIDLKEAADSFASKYTGDYVKNFAPLYREDRQDEQKKGWYEYHYNIKSETAPGRDGVTVYKAVIDYYEGGAHGINQLLVFNFDNDTGRKLTLADVFVPGYEQTLCQLLLDALTEETGAKDLDGLHDMGYLYSMDLFAPENFILGDDAVTFIYNPYEIAPYTMGLIKLTIDNDDLEKLWKSSKNTSRN